MTTYALTNRHGMIIAVGGKQEIEKLSKRVAESKVWKFPNAPLGGIIG